MENIIPKANSLDFVQLPQNHIFISDRAQWNYFQRSGMQPPSQMLIETFGSFNSFSVREIESRQPNQIRFTDNSLRESDFQTYFQEQQPFFVMSFRRGTSEAYEPIQLGSIIENQFMEVDTCKLFEQEASCEQECFKNESKRPLLSDLSEQEFKSNSINSLSDIDSKKNEALNSRAQGLLAKNVTKNIGKLLMKFIWKNRDGLKKKMRPDPTLWQTFISLIQVWKKENNITRQFLISKWQSKGEENKMFRMVAHHFFRKHCLSAILKSNIRLKKIHYERILKFDQAIVNPKALDYLS